MPQPKSKTFPFGVKYFEICEGRRPCEITGSPYVLKNQFLADEIAVKAYDHDGNLVIAMVPPPRDLYAGEFGISPWEEHPIVFSLFLLGIVLFFVYRLIVKV